MYAPLVPTPSVVIRYFLKTHKIMSKLSDLAKSVLLSVKDVKMWIEHLQVVSKNRRRGAAEAAATHSAKNSKQRLWSV